jgi:3'(2'), 5'-bisphosphate nucleotidase
MASRLQRELDVACTAVQHCAVLTKKLQQATLTPTSQLSKSDFSPVTVGDFAAQALLTAATHEAFPSDHFVAEESSDELRTHAALLNQVWDLVRSVRRRGAESGNPASKDELLELIDRGGQNGESAAGRVWVFDPIDGTATFLRGQQYAVNCALLVDGREELGVIGCPNVRLEADGIREDDVDGDGWGVMIFAVRGEGTWVRPMQDGDTLAPARRLVRHGDTVTMEGLVWCDCSTYTSTLLPLHRELAARLNTPWPGLDLFSSLMKYASLGLGRSHVVVRIFQYTSWRSNIWDHAGGILIFEEAGGKVTDLDGKRIDFTTGRKMTASE